MAEKTPSRVKGKADPDWAREAVNLLHSVIRRHGVTLHDLRDLLEKRGLSMTYKGLSNKICRGRFQLAFFLEAMAAIRVRAIRLEPDEDDEPAPLTADLRPPKRTLRRSRTSVAPSATPDPTKTPTGKQ